jgi:hypothetical protein
MPEINNDKIRVAAGIFKYSRLLAHAEHQMELFSFSDK